MQADLAAAMCGMRDIPEEACATVRRGVTDWLGVTIAGSAEPVVARVRAALGALGPAEARLLPSGERCSTRNAALINGVAGHVLDYDDVAGDFHPSAVMVPALLAEAELIGATCADLIRGYMAGYETWAALRSAVEQPLHGAGWHPSSVYGPLAAAAACAALHRLDVVQTGHALGLAVAQAGGLVANFGSMAKSFQVGHAAEAGLLAVRLARAGVDAAPGALAGFLANFGGGARAGRIGFGQPDWAILTEGLDIKAYPICYGAHRLVDAARQLAIDSDAVEAIDLRLGRIQSSMLHSHRPRTVLEAKFSAEFAVAAVLVAGRLGLAEMTESFLARPDLQRLIACCSRSLDDELGEPPFSPFDMIKVRLRDGATVTSGRVRHATGSRHAPPTRQDAWAKFSDAAGPHASNRLFDALWTLPPDRPIAALLDALC